jgi:hypothetical protein
MKTTTPFLSYDGEPVYVGIDVHKRTYTVVAHVGQTVVKKWSMMAKPVQLEQQGQGIDNIVVHAAAVEVVAHNRVKTDKRDADKLSALLAAGHLQSIVIPPLSKNSDGC